MWRNSQIVWHKLFLWKTVYPSSKLYWIWNISLKLIRTVTLSYQRTHVVVFEVMKSFKKWKFLIIYANSKAFELCWHICNCSEKSTVNMQGDMGDSCYNNQSKPHPPGLKPCGGSTKSAPWGYKGSFQTLIRSFFSCPA